MLEDYDPYLSNFIKDVGAFMTIIVETIKFAVGLGYFLGGKSVKFMNWLYTSTLEGYQWISVATVSVQEEITEFGGAFLRAVLLIYYGLIKIVDSFYITAVDLANFSVYFAESISRTISGTCCFISDSVFDAFFEVPHQVIEALSMVGDAAVTFCKSALAVVCDFLQQIVLSPLKVILLLSKVLVHCVLTPVHFISQMPTSSLLGLLVIVICVFMFRKVLRYMILKNFVWLITGVLSLFSKLMSFLQVTELKRMITSTVLTVAKLKDQEGASGNHKVACVICQDKPVCFMSNPCKHVCLCDICVHNLVQHDSRCPICRGRVTKYDRVFIP